MSKKTVIFVIFSTLIGFLLYKPTPKSIQPEKYKPESPLCLDELNSPKNKLDNAVYIRTPAPGAEDVQIDVDGNAYSGLHDGSIIRIKKGTTQSQVIAKSEGPIFGISLNSDGSMLAVADQVLGIRILDLKTGKFENIASEYKGVKFASPNGVVFGKKDETLYFSVSSEFVKMSEFHEMLLYSEGSGRIFSINLKTREIELLAKGLYFVNGIQYDQSNDCLYFLQTSRSRLSKLQLVTKKIKIILENILGYPDNVKFSEDGNLWVAIPALRDGMSNLIDHTTLLRKFILNVRMPLEMFLALANMKYAGGIKVNPQNGEIIQYFFGKGDKINCISGINERDGKLYLSSLGQDKIALVDLKNHERKTVQEGDKNGDL